ncbi:tRNA (guanine-N(7)-)-methyltransferase non-catalytic subunit wuho-like [Bolinopsis microptera]|uniref:tRNA (guanine-N(7)-)-methyltransferase non-catalytic subunit wuho-like n=1 Tax=Bolinopsis microptera TaxID=2820187 RepID=UPI003078EC50
MSVLHFDKHSNTFLIGIGENLYQYSNNQTTFLTKCGEYLDIPAPEQEIKENKRAPRAEGNAYITGVASCEECVAVISNNKIVETFNRQFQKQASVVAMKRPTSVQVTNKNVVISDKSGDAHSYDLSLANQKYLLGHVSVVMDTVMTPDHKFLITCDRDEKIRISHFPNCYNIEAYLLAHQEYVLKILLLSPNTLLSVGGDQNLLLWDLTSKTLLQTVSSTKGDFTSVTYTSPYLITCNLSHVTVYKLTNNTLAQVSELTLDHGIVSLAASDSHVVVLTRKVPSTKLALYQFSEGVMSSLGEIEGEFDLSKCVETPLPEKIKTGRTAGFAGYFERKRKRIEEEALKEETRQVKLNS